MSAPQRPLQRHPRVRTELPAVWRASFDGIIRNLSVGGLFLEAATAPRINSRIELEFSLPDTQRQVRVVAIVKWLAALSPHRESPLPFGAGLEFLELLPDDRQALIEYVGSLENQNPATKSGITFPVEFRFNGVFYEATAGEISETGIFLFTDKPLDLDDVIHMRIRLPEGHEFLKIRGVVRWRHSDVPAALHGVVPLGMGIEFTMVAEDERAAIRDFIADQAEKAAS